MDRTDYQILNILQKDCRTTLKHIGDQVGLTAPAVSERVRRMEEKGVIRGCCALRCGGRGNWMNFSLPLSDTETHRLRWSSKLILRPKKSRRLADLT